MGATTFSTTAKGGNATEAFKNAREEAFYWHGHGGYSGTIAEKSGFSVCNIPTDIPQMIDPDALRWNFADRIQSAFNAWEDAVCDASREEHLKNNYHFNPSTDQIVAELKKESEYASSRQSKADALWLLSTLGARAMVDLVRSHNDKWGKALAIRTGNDEWTFIGLASC